MTVALFRSLASRYRSVVVSSAYSLALRVGGAVVTFGLGVTLARVLGPAGYGIYGLITTLVALAVTISLVGTLQLAVRELSVRSARGDWPGVKGVIFEFNRATALAAAAIGLVGMAIVAAMVGFGEPTTYALQAALLTLALAITAGIASQLRGLGALIRGQILDIFARPAVTFVVTLGLVLVGWRLTVAQALWIQVGVAIAAAAISLMWIRLAIPAAQRAVPRARKIPWVGAAVPLGIVDSLRQMDGAYGVILMGWLASAPELGLFRVAVACGVIINMPITIAHVLFGPTAARLNGTGEHRELQRLLSSISAALVAIILPITAAVWFFGRDVMILVFGAPYAEAWLPLFYISCAQLVSACFGLGPTLLAMCDSERHLMKICALSLAAGLVAAVPLIQLYGAAGAGIATVVSGGLIALFSQRFARRSLNLDPSLLSLGRR